MPVWLWMVLVIVVLVVVGNYISEGLIRLMFYILAVVVAVALVIKLTGLL